MDNSIAAELKSVTTLIKTVDQMIAQVDAKDGSLWGAVESYAKRHSLKTEHLSTIYSVIYRQTGGNPGAAFTLGLILGEALGPRRIGFVQP